jgi:hypothetical protein
MSRRDADVARYRALVRQELPAAARAGSWVLREDHCFGRVLLDHAVGACWYDVLDRRRTAFLQLTDEQLAQAVALGEQLLVEGDPLLRRLDERSLAWRGKPRTTGRRQGPTGRGGAGPVTGPAPRPTRSR